MCIVAIAWQLFDEMPLVLLSNRDEFFDRSTTPAHQWVDAPIYAGRDNKSDGTWLGHHQTVSNSQIAQNGRWAAVLNFRDGVQAGEEQRSRGELVTQFLISELSPLTYARNLDLQAYAGFNLIIGDSHQAVLVNNRGYPPTLLHSGLHVLSNGQPDSNWFKSERLRGRVRQEILPLIAESFEYYQGDISYWQSAAWNALSDTRSAPTSDLPDTGLPTDLEQSLSSICIDTPDIPHYGTRTQSILLIEQLLSQDRLGEHYPHATLISREYINQKYTGNIRD